MAIERARQFKILLSNDEWEKLIDIAEVDDTSASDVVRTFINRRYQEVVRPDAQDWNAAAEGLCELARKIRQLATRPTKGQRKGR